MSSLSFMGGGRALQGHPFGCHPNQFTLIRLGKPPDVVLLHNPLGLENGSLAVHG